MFDHKDIEKYAIEDVPLDRDIFLISEKWLEEYDRALMNVLNGGAYEVVGYIAYAAARKATAAGVEISWYPNIFDRFHEMRIHLPRSSFVTCVGCRDIDEKPRIFVKDAWLEDIYHRTNSVFAMVDAVRVKDALAAGKITTDRLDDLRNRIDEIGSRFTDIAFISFADSLLLKSNWSVGTRSTGTNYTYNPERILQALPEIAAAYRDSLCLSVYVVITQGRNEFYRDELIHVSAPGNHISLNSLGLPFAQLQAIEYAARAAIKAGGHRPAEIYMDAQFFHSLNWRDEYAKNDEPSFSYRAPMVGRECAYVPAQLEVVLGNLDFERKIGVRVKLALTRL